MKFLLLIITFCIFSPVMQATEIGHATNLSRQHQVGDDFMGIKLLGMLELSGSPVQGLAAHELSALAWDDDDQILYALSDKGYLLYLKPQFENDNLIGIELVDSYVLKDEQRNALKGRRADSEGMAIENGRNGLANDAELIISFEIEPRITRFTRKGVFLNTIPLPNNLNNVEAFSYKNAALESVIRHPKFGFITAPQMPLSNAPYKWRTIHDLNGNVWKFEAMNPRHSSITDLAITEQDQVLILERNYSSILSPIQIFIRKAELTLDNMATIPTETVAVFDSSKGWRIDNYEGLTLHKNNRFFMISDDNQNIFQNTFFIYFELLD